MCRGCAGPAPRSMRKWWRSGLIRIASSSASASLASGASERSAAKLAQALLRRSQEDLLQSRELLALSGRRSAGAKVAGLLMGLAEAASDSSCHPAREFELPLTRGEMAGMLGLTIETVSRAITRFERDGMIRRKGARGIELADPARLGFEVA